MIRIPYTYIAFAFGIIIVFYKIGDLDDEIGWVLGLGTGILISLSNYYFRGGFWGLVLHVIGGFVLLTVYKFAKDLLRKSSQNVDLENDDYSNPSC